MGKYKHGKQEHIMDFEEVKQKVLDAKLPRNDEAFFWLLYWCGTRKSEAYERVAEDFEVTDTYLIVDFGQRKKGSAKVDPLEIPLNYYGVDKIVEAIEKANQRKKRIKNFYVYVDKKRTAIRKKGRWIFPHVQSTKAWEIVRKVLGEGYYPHFLRLNRLSIIGSDPTASLTRLKSFSGIKSVRSMEYYLGVSKKEQQKAMEFSGKEAGQE